jgi:hypothetical protein
VQDDSKPTAWAGRMAASRVPEYELQFMMKLGRMERSEALSLLAMHHGDRDAVYASLTARLKRPS